MELCDLFIAPYSGDLQRIAVVDAATVREKLAAAAERSAVNEVKQKFVGVSWNERRRRANPVADVYDTSTEAGKLAFAQRLEAAFPLKR